MTSAPRRPAYLQLVKSPPPASIPAGVVTYTNRHGEPYYLHEGRTKTGKARYFVSKGVGDGALRAMPEGFEITESINGVVSVRRTDPSRGHAPVGDLEAVRSEVARHAHLRRCVVEERGGEIFINEPEGGVDEAALGTMAAAFFVSPERMGEASTPRRHRYRPVMRFSPDAPGVYAVYRMTYRGQGGWHILSAGPLAAMAKRFVAHIGKESFFELM
jgi:hypothetical protein